MEPVSDSLYWRDVEVCGQRLSDGHVCRGEHVRFVMNANMQQEFLNHFFPQFLLSESGEANVWLEHQGSRLIAGTPEFCARIGSMIRRRGLLANLNMRENLLLPFLYAENANQLKKAESEVDDIADFLGLTTLLYEQAGERSAYTHALISLGHCLLKKPDVIVAQEVHIGMPPDRLEIFRDKAAEAMQMLGSGILYLSSSPHEGSGLNFGQTHEVECGNVPDVSGLW